MQWFKPILVCALVVGAVVPPSGCDDPGDGGLATRSPTNAVESEEPDPGADDADGRTSTEARFIAVARVSPELKAIESRLAGEFPGSTIDRSAGYSVVGDPFGEGDLIGVYFPVGVGEGVNFVSLWYEQDGGGPVHTVVSILDDAQSVVWVEVDGHPAEADDLSTALAADGDGELTPRSGMLSQCLSACASGVAARNTFCRSLPTPYLKAGCWAVVYGSYPICAGFCWWQWG